jgi:hypothetical protein
MRLKYLRESLAVGWVFLLLVIGIVGGFTSMTSWTELAAIAIVPIVIGARLWRVSAPTMSEIIHQARG